MVCEIVEKKELSLSEMIKILYEFDDLDTLIKCVNQLKEEVSLDELNKLSDEEIFKYFIDSQGK